jgi:hypothetical protein
VNAHCAKTKAGLSQVLRVQLLFFENDSTNDKPYWALNIPNVEDVKRVSRASNSFSFGAMEKVIQQAPVPS